MKKSGPPVPNRRFPGYENVYMDNDTSGIVKPIVTSPAKSSEDLKLAKVKLLRQSSSGNERNLFRPEPFNNDYEQIPAMPSPAERLFSEPDDVTFQKINRIQAEEQLSNQPMGTYLIRTSGKGTKKGYALSIKSVGDQNIFDHYKIIKDHSGYYIEDEYKYKSFQQLIHQYQLEKQPVLSAQLLYPLITKGSFKRIFDARLFDKEDVQLSNTVGKGEYGQVYAGQLVSSNAKIAAKEINLPLRNNTGEIMPVRLNLFSEIRLLAKLSKTKENSKNIVQHFGIIYSPGNNLKIIEELMEGGSLLDALKTHGRQYLQNSKLISYCKQIASGLLYLKKNQIIHRDIAARNIFLSKNLDIAKIGDFGLAITTTEIATLPRDIDTLLASKIAVKWTAPEALKNAKYSFKSDVWSFGILIWEMWTYGRSPYRKTLVENVLNQIIEINLRCEIPEATNSSNQMPRELMYILSSNSRTMWSLLPEERISIEDALEIIQHIH